MIKKILLASLLFSALQSFSYAQLFKSKTDKQTKFATPVTLSTTKIPIKKAESWFYYSIANNQAETHHLKIADMRYNTAGELVEWKVFDMNGDLDYIYLYEYENNPKKIKRFIQHQEAEPILDFSESYNSKNQLIKSEYFGQNGKLIETNEWEFDKNDRICASTKRNDKNVLIYKIKYEQDQQGRSRKETHFNLQTDESYDLAFTYDNNNLLIQENRYFSTGELDKKNIFSYDEKQRVVEKKVYKGKEIEVVEKYIYSSINNEVAHATYTDGGKELAEYMVYKYEFN
jgi:hypothetical protein